MGIDFLLTSPHLSVWRRYGIVRRVLMITRRIENLVVSVVVYYLGDGFKTRDLLFALGLPLYMWLTMTDTTVWH